MLEDIEIAQSLLLLPLLLSLSLESGSIVGNLSPLRLTGSKTDVAAKATVGAVLTTASPVGEVPFPSSSNTFPPRAGAGSTAAGAFSLAMGNGNNATGEGAVTFGLGTEASAQGGVAIGKNNATTDAAFVVGNGADANNKSDALVVNSDGSAVFSGDVTVNSDMRLKANIISLGSTIAKLLQIDGKSYNERCRYIFV